MDGLTSAGFALEGGRAATAPIRVLTFSTLFPHRGRLNHGVFVENRLRQLIATGRVESTVVAPVPWVPRAMRRSERWGMHADAPAMEQRHGVTSYHPRYIIPPKVGMSAAPAALFAAGAVAIRRLLAAGVTFDLIDGHYVYPDGVAAAALGKLFGRPVVLTARGSDITQYPDYALPRRMVTWAMREADALISVSAGLKSAMVALGAPPDKVTVLRNGVDLRAFTPTDPAPVRTALGLKGKLLLSVGHLIERKRHDLAIGALETLPGWSLAILGEGPERGTLEALAVRLGVQDRVRFCGMQPHAALPAYYSAADMLILASSREGWANVLLEAMACGTRVVASNIPGNPEVVTSPAAGAIVRENTAACFAETIAAMQAQPIGREETRAYAEGFSWDATSAGQIEVFDRVLANYRSAPGRRDNS